MRQSFLTNTADKLIVFKNSGLRKNCFGNVIVIYCVFNDELVVASRKVTANSYESGEI